MLDIIPFTYESNEIRVIQDESGDPWWFASDVCKALGLSNPTEALRSLDGDEKMTLRISEGQKSGRGGAQSQNIINEPGLYRLLSRSNKVKARKFQRLVFHEVLPQIRKTGFYEPNKVTLSLLQREANSAKRLANTFGFVGNQALLSANRAMKKIYDIDCLELMGTVHLISDDTELHMTPTDLGQNFKKSAKIINALIKTMGLQIDHRDKKNKLKWEPTEKGMPYAVFKDTGKRHSDGTPVQQLFWKKSVLGILESELSGEK